MKNVLLSILTFWAIALPLIGQQRPSETKPASGISVNQLLKPDGSLDLSKGYKGNLDLSGFDVSITKDGPKISSRTASTTTDDDRWTSLGGFPGTDGNINAMATDGTNLYIGGQFKAVGNVVAHAIAKWDGNSWYAIGSGFEGATVYALAVDGNGRLYAGCGLTGDGLVAYWDETSWVYLSSSTPFSGNHFGGDIYTLLPDGNGGIYAGGSFSLAQGSVADEIAYWNGIAWSDIGFQGSRSVRAIVSDGNGGIYVGGQFNDSVSGLNRIAHYNGNTWSALGSGLNNDVNALVPDGNGGVYVGGAFTTAGGNTANRIAHWNGTTWSDLESGFNADVNSLISDGNGGLYAGGFFITAGGVPANRIAHWDGSNWSAIGDGTDGGVSAMTLYGNNLVAGGSLTTAGGNAALNIAQWNGTNWSALTTGTNAYINTIVLDGNGGMYAGGKFTSIGQAEANYVAYYNGSSWSALGSGMNNEVNTLVLDSNGGLYAGGFFTTAGGATANYLAYWNGNSWADVGGGLSSGFGRRVNTILPTSNGGLYIGGKFTAAGGTSASRIAYWDGTSWFGLGSGVIGDVQTIISDGNGGIYVGGAFTTAGGNTANSIAHWDGNTWSTLGSGFNSTVYSIIPDGNGGLYAAGSFYSTDSSTPTFIAHWDGNNWSALSTELGYSTGAGTTGNVKSILSDGNGGFYATGRFIGTGSTTLNHIGHWDGTTWTALGSGLDYIYSTVFGNTLVHDGNGSLYVCGNFSIAGNKASAFLAKYTTQTSPLAAFTQSATAIVEGQTVTFDASGSTGEGLTYSWNFAGGTPATSTEVNPTITFNTPGNSAVSLTVTEGSNTHTANGTVEVGLNAPTAVSATPNIANSITITWTDNTQHESGYEIIRSSASTEDAANGFATVDATYTVGPNITTFTDTNLSAGTIYYYRVRAKKN